MATAIAAGPLPLCPIASLPPELQISICAHLSPRSLVALAACSSTLAAVCLSHSVLREVLIDALGIEPQGALRDHLEFVLTMKARTGWFLSSRAYTSRLINVRIEWAAGNHQPALIADEIDPGNGYALDSEDPLRAPAPPVLPLGCVMDLEGASYTVPRWGPGSNQPDRGLSVDLLLPVYDAYPLFSVTSSASRWNAAEPASTHNARIHLKSITRPLLPPVPDTEETRSDTLFGLWTGRSPIQTRNWPSRELIGSRNADLYFQGPALALGDWVGERGAIVGDERAIELVDGALPGFQVQIVKSATPVVEADRAQPGLTTRVQRQFPDNAQDARFVRDEGAQPEGVGLFRLQGRLGARLSTLPREEEDVVNGEVIKGPSRSLLAEQPGLTPLQRSSSSASERRRGRSAGAMPRRAIRSRRRSQSPRFRVSGSARTAATVSSTVRAPRTVARSGLMIHRLHLGQGGVPLWQRQLCVRRCPPE